MKISFFPGDFFGISFPFELKNVGDCLFLFLPFMTWRRSGLSPLPPGSRQQPWFFFSQK